MSQTLGRFEIVRKLGEGGMGDVYLAHDPQAGTMVAIKTIRRELLDHPNKLARFQREMDLQRQVAHPNIARLIERGEARGVHFLVLEYIEGQELEVDPGGMDLLQACHIAERVCLALHHVHQQGIIHRDMKPSNVLLDAMGNPHVIDFGVAKSLVGEQDVQLTRDGAFVGTLDYASPEQAEGILSEVDHRSDIFNLGAMLYKMVTGRTPFFDPKKNDPAELRMRIVREHPIEPRRLRPEIPPDLERIILRALAKDKAKRYQSAEELAGDIEKFRAGERVRVAYSPKADKAMQWLARHRLMVGAISTALVGVLAASVLYSHKLKTQEIAQRARADLQVAEALRIRRRDIGRDRVLANRVLLNFPGHAGAARLLNSMRKAQGPAAYDRQLAAGLSAQREGDQGKASLHLTQAYLIQPRGVARAGYHFFDGAWITEQRARQLGVTNEAGQRKSGQHWIGRAWFPRKAAIGQGFLLYDAKEDRYYAGDEARARGWVHSIDSGWIRPETAIAQGLVFLDRKSGKYLTPKQAEQRGWLFSGNRWQTPRENEKAGRGMLRRGRWYTANQALRLGYRHRGEAWRHVSDAWRSLRDAGPREILAPRRVSALAWGNREQWFALGTTTGQVLLYSKAGLARPRITHVHTRGSAVRRLRFAPEDRHLVVWSADGLLAVYEIAADSLLLRARALRNQELHGARLVEAREYTREVAYRDTRSLLLRHIPDEVHRRRQVDAGGIFSDIDWSRDARDVVLVTGEHLLHFDLERGKPVARIATPFAGERYARVAFQPGGVIAVARDRTVHLLDGRDSAQSATGGQIVLRGLVTPGPVMDLEFDALGESLIVIFRTTGDADKEAVRGWIWHARGFD